MELRYYEDVRRPEKFVRRPIFTGFRLFTDPKNVKVETTRIGTFISLKNISTSSGIKSAALGSRRDHYIPRPLRPIGT